MLQGCLLYCIQLILLSLRAISFNWTRVYRVKATHTYTAHVKETDTERQSQIDNISRAEITIRYNIDMYEEVWPMARCSRPIET